MALPRKLMGLGEFFNLLRLRLNCFVNSSMFPFPCRVSLESSRVARLVDLVFGQAAPSRGIEVQWPGKIFPFLALLHTCTVQYIPRTSCAPD